MAVNKLLGKVFIIILAFPLILGLVSCQGQKSYYVSELGIKATARDKLLENVVILRMHYRVDFITPTGAEESYEFDDYFSGTGFGKYILTLRSNLVPGPFFISTAEDLKIYYNDYELKDTFDSSVGLVTENLALLELPEGVEVATFKIGDSSQIREGDKLLIPTGIFMEGEELTKGILPQSLVAKSFPLYSDREFLIYGGAYDGTSGAPLLAVTNDGEAELVGMLSDTSFTGIPINDIIEIVLNATGIDLRK